jgi:glycosyltransferase involved in cell wall biosynthesis
VADAGGVVSDALVPAPGTARAPLRPEGETTDEAAPLRIVALASLPYLSDGRPAFHGGATIFAAQLLAGLAARGHRIRVLADAPPGRPGERRSPLDLGAPRLDVDWFAYEHHSSVRQPTGPARSALHARVGACVERALAALRPDVLLVGREVVLPCALAPARGHGVATVLVSHGPAVGELDAGRYPPELHDELIAAVRAVDHVVAVADHVAEALARLGATRVETIRNVADPARFRPAPRDARLMRALDVAPDAIVVVHVSMLRPWKRVADLVDSAALVLRREPRCVYLIVGDGPCRKELEEHVRRLGIEGAFRFTGEIAHGDVARHLALADVVVHPSEREGLPLVYREVQACGRALVASDIAAAREAIEPGRTGLLFPTGDVGALAARTLDLASDPGLRARIGAAARAAAERDSVPAWLARYEAVLRRAARGR